MTLALALSLGLAIIVNYPEQSHSSVSYPQPNQHIRHDQLDENMYRQCDQESCDSLVSKCTLTQRCACDFKKDAICAKDCIDCLEEKFGKCCACVGLCPPAPDDRDPSHVGNIAVSDEEFFQVLTEEDDIHGRWSVDRFSSSLRLAHPERGQIELEFNEHNSTTKSFESHIDRPKCTVAFINRHLSMTKCKRSCTTMGASSFRWFHDGCCECVGRYCSTYGIDKQKCLIKYDSEL